MDHLNRYCRANRLATSTRRDLREYLFRAKHVQAGEAQRDLMLLMSPKLQGDLSLQVGHRAWRACSRRPWRGASGAPPAARRPVARRPRRGARRTRRQLKSMVFVAKRNTHTHTHTHTNKSRPPMMN